MTINTRWNESYGKRREKLSWNSRNELDCRETKTGTTMKHKVKQAAEEVFEQLGSGWSETIYHSALQRELSERGIAHHSEGTIPVMYKGAPVGRRRPDMFIVAENGDTVIVEMKAGSSSGKGQLVQYLDLVMADENYGQIIGGAVIRFNKEFEFEYATVNHDTTKQQDLQTFEDNN